MRLYDTLILGAGPAGLSTALGLGRQNRSCLVLSNQIFRNDGIHASHAVLGHDHVHPQEILAKARSQIARYNNTEYVQTEIITAEKVSLSGWSDRSGFMLKSKDGQSWTGKTLVLAAGVKDKFPEIEGFAENWPQNIYQCLFCDGWERRDKRKAVLTVNGVGMSDCAMASMSMGMSKDVEAGTVILNNGPLKAEEKVMEKLKRMKARGVVVDERKVVKLEDAAPELGVCVHFEVDGKIEKELFGYLFHKPGTQLNAAGLIEQLGVETEPAMFGTIIKTAGIMPSTNVEGVFAAGDSGNALTHVTAAMLSGVGAAGGVVSYLNAADDEDAYQRTVGEVQHAAGVRNQEAIQAAAA